MYGGGGGEIGGSSWKAPEEANVVIGGGGKFDDDVSTKATHSASHVSQFLFRRCQTYLVGYRILVIFSFGMNLMWAERRNFLFNNIVIILPD